MKRNRPKGGGAPKGGNCRVDDGWRGVAGRSRKPSLLHALNTRAPSKSWGLNEGRDRGADLAGNGHSGKRIVNE
jgi:hypothetical protein